MESIVDIIKIAIENEVKAKVFYAKAGDLASDGEAQMVFMELVEMEDQHARRLVDNFGELMRRDGVDAEAFLAELESDTEKTLGAEEAKLLEDADLRPVIDFAIQMESQARDNYLQLGQRVEAGELREFCEELAAEEQRHFDQLTEARIGVDTPIDERPAL